MGIGMAAEVKVVTIPKPTPKIKGAEVNLPLREVETERPLNQPLRGD